MEKLKISVPRKITVCGFSATINVQFVKYSNGDNFYYSQSQVAKAVKAIATAAGFKVLKCTSDSFAGGDSVRIEVGTELTEEQRTHNDNVRQDGYYHPHDMHKEPRAQLLSDICNEFQNSQFDSMIDLSESKSCYVINDPSNQATRFGAKYVQCSFSK